MKTKQILTYEWQVEHTDEMGNIVEISTYEKLADIGELESGERLVLVRDRLNDSGPDVRSWFYPDQGGTVFQDGDDMGQPVPEKYLNESNSSR